MCHHVSLCHKASQTLDPTLSSGLRVGRASWTAPNLAMADRWSAGLEPEGSRGCVSRMVCSHAGADGLGDRPLAGAPTHSACGRAPPSRVTAPVTGDGSRDPGEAATLLVTSSWMSRMPLHWVTLVGRPAQSSVGGLDPRLPGTNGPPGPLSTRWGQWLPYAPSSCLYCARVTGDSPPGQ